MIRNVTFSAATPGEHSSRSPPPTSSSLRDRLTNRPATPRSPFRRHPSRRHLPAGNHPQDAVHELAQRRELLSPARPNAPVKYTKCLKSVLRCADLLEVRVVDVGVDAKEAGENLAHHPLEVFGKGRALRERRGVIRQALHPLQEVIDVFGGAARDGFLHADAVRPPMLVLGPGAHRRAVGVRAIIGQGGVEHRDGVVKVDGVDREPLVEVLAREREDSLAQVAAPEGGVDVLLERGAFSVLKFFFGLRERGDGRGESDVGQIRPDDAIRGGGARIGVPRSGAGPPRSAESRESSAHRKVAASRTTNWARTWRERRSPGGARREGAEGICSLSCLFELLESSTSVRALSDRPLPKPQETSGETATWRPGWSPPTRVPSPSFDYTVRIPHLCVVPSLSPFAPRARVVPVFFPGNPEPPRSFSRARRILSPRLAAVVAPLAAHASPTPLSPQSTSASAADKLPRERRT